MAEDTSVKPIEKNYHLPQYPVCRSTAKVSDWAKTAWNCALVRGYGIILSTGEKDKPLTGTGALAEKNAIAATKQVTR